MRGGTLAPARLVPNAAFLSVRCPQGYGEADDTWEPREGLRHLDVFKEYDKEYKDELKELAQLAKSMKKSRTPGKRK